MTGMIADVLSGAARWTVCEGDCLAILATLPDACVDHVVTDPPYSEQVHTMARTNRRRELPDVALQPCRSARRMDLGFRHITQPEREAVADVTERLTRRWVLLFSDVESLHLWRGAFTVFDYCRTAQWVRTGGMPQVSGDRPSPGFEVILCMHAPGRKRWNGGGKAGTYIHPIVANRLGERGSRVHPTQKPLNLMLDLIDDFTDPGDIILDPYCGSGTTGVACIMRGRRFIGIERDPKHAETARKRLSETQEGLVIAATRPKQTVLFR
jgi:site-specific DNA-methyltransferase (adenine-specific)